MSTATLIALLVLAAIGAAALLLVVGRVRVTRLGLGSSSVPLSAPIDFGSWAVGLPTALVGTACLAGAVWLAGPDRFGRGGPEATPLPPDQLVIVDQSEDRTIVRPVQPDSMAAATVAEATSDFTVAVDAEVRVGTDEAVACLAFRVSGEAVAPGRYARTPRQAAWPVDGYLFCLSRGGQWSLARFDDGQPEVLRSYRQWTALDEGGVNRLSVEARGPSLVLAINGVEAARLQDDRHPSGEIQVVCGTPPEKFPTAACHFTRLEVAPAG